MFKAFYETIKFHKIQKAIFIYFTLLDNMILLIDKKVYFFNSSKFP